MSRRWSDAEVIRPGVSRVSRGDKNMLWIAATVSIWGAALVVGFSGPTDSGPECHEDEVVVWTGEDHDHCVPIDKFEDGSSKVWVDTEYCEPTDQESAIGHGLMCEIDPAA